jgi:hypothetical protein
MLLQHLALFLAETAGDDFQILADLIEHASKILAILDLPVELIENLVRTVRGSDRLIVPGVSPAGPGVCPIAYVHAELERAETRGSSFFDCR